MQEPTSIKQMIQGMAPSSVEVVQGKVISASPLKIQLLNDEKMELSGNIICLPKHLSTYQTTVDIAAGGDIGNINGVSMTVYNGLKTGEVVYILSFNNGKKYFILDRRA